MILLAFTTRIIHIMTQAEGLRAAQSPPAAAAAAARPEQRDWRVDPWRGCWGSTWRCGRPHWRKT